MVKIMAGEGDGGIGAGWMAAAALPPPGQSGTLLPGAVGYRVLGAG